MTTINLNVDKYTYSMEIDGHTNYGAHGSDILCASISMLAQTFLYYVQAKEEDAEAYIKSIAIESGHIKIVATGDLEDAFRMVSLGFDQLAKQYPEYVQLGKKSDEGF